MLFAGAENTDKMVRRWSSWQILAIRGGALVPRTGMMTLGKEECTRVELVGEKKMSHEGNNGGGWMVALYAGAEWSL
jgi:hypothetical protein